MSAILIVMALVCAFSVAVSVRTEWQATAGLRAELATQAGDDMALRASLDIADNAEQQDAEVRAAIARTLESTGVEFETARTLEGGAILSAGDMSGPAEALTIPDLESRATFDAGTAPQGPNEVAVQADAAATLGLSVGDEVTINQVTFVVRGTWRPVDSLDPRWFGDETVATGGTDRLGPFVITEDAWPQFDLPPTAVWTVFPASIDDFTWTNSGSVSGAWATIPQDWRGAVSGFDSLKVQRGLARTLDNFDRRIEGLRVIEPVAGGLVAGTALVVLAQLVQLLIATRERETLLFWARGRSTPAIAWRTAREVAVTTALGAIAGVTVTALGLTVFSGASRLLQVRPSAFAVPAIVFLASIAIAIATAYRSVGSITLPTKGGRENTRTRRIAVPGAAILFTVAASLSVWQLQRDELPLTSEEEPPSIDPIVVVAPVVALIAVVLAALAVFPYVVGLYARRTQHSGLGKHLTARTLARQTSRVAAPLVIVALAVGTATVGATFSATWSHLFTQNAELHSGADIRISSPLAPLSAEQRDAVAATDRVSGVAPLDVQTLSVGSATASLVAATPDALRQLTTEAGDVFSPSTAADAIRVDDPGPLIPGEATNLTLRVKAFDFDEPPALSAWIADSLGSVRQVMFDGPAVETDGILAYSVALADSGHRGPSSLVSLDLSFADQPFDGARPRFQLESLDAQVGGTVEKVKLDQFWMLDTLSELTVPPKNNPTGDGFVLDDGLPSLRMTASTDGTENDELRPGVVVTERLAASLRLHLGDVIAFNLRGVVGNTNAVVGAIVPAIPAADSDMALLMDLSAINHFHQRTSRSAPESSDLWVMTENQRQVRDTVRGILPANAQVDLRDDPGARQVLGAASTALWAAAVACLLFAVIAVASASHSRMRWGRGDIASLRALGMRAGEQSAVVVREFVVVLVVAALAGGAAGVLVSVLAVPQLARIAVDREYLTPATPLAVDWLGLSLLLGALSVGILAILMDLRRRIGSLASRLLPGAGHE